MIKGATRTRKSVAKGTENIGTYEAKLKAGKTEKMVWKILCNLYRWI